MNDPNLPLAVYVAVGVVVLWCKTSKANRNIYGLSPIVAMSIKNEQAKGALELIVFLTIGWVICDGLIAPSTPAQAVAAGLGWTGLMTK
jgi:hypothetical protein